MRGGGGEIDVVVVFGPIMVWSSCMDRNGLGFSAGIANFFFFCVGRK